MHFHTFYQLTNSHTIAQSHSGRTPLFRTNKFIYVLFFFYKAGMVKHTHAHTYIGKDKERVGEQAEIIAGIIILHQAVVLELLVVRL